VPSASPGSAGPDHPLVHRILTTAEHTVASAYIAENAERDTPPWRKNPATNSEMRNDCPGADAVYATVAEASARALPPKRPVPSLDT